MPTEIYPYWAGLCCMADSNSLTPQALHWQYSENPSHLIDVLSLETLLLGFEDELGLPAFDNMYFEV